MICGRNKVNFIMLCSARKLISSHLIFFIWLVVRGCTEQYACMYVCMYLLLLLFLIIPVHVYKQ